MEAKSRDAALTDEASAVTLLSTITHLRDQLAVMELEQGRMIESGVQHLRELAVLNRIADTLARPRTVREVLQDAASEAGRLIGARDRLWIVQPDDRGQPAEVILPQPDAEAQPFTDLPAEVRDLFARVTAECSDETHRLPAYEEAAGTGDPMFVGLPIITARHLPGVMVVQCREPSDWEQWHGLRLLQSICRQAAVACENSQLLVDMGRMIADVVMAMAAAVESRDPYTGGHTQRVTAYMLLLGRQVGFDEKALAVLHLGGLLHDIGKVAVPDAILRKTGRLTADEFDVIKTHPVVGFQIVSRIPHLACTNEIIRHHHERWDGLGYPDGLAGEQISRLARVAAVADTFDAMTSDRPYRRGLSFEIVRDEIRRCAGTQFDAGMAEAFLSLPITELRAVAEADGDASLAGPVEPVDLTHLLSLPLLRNA